MTSEPLELDDRAERALRMLNAAFMAAGDRGVRTDAARAAGQAAKPEFLEGLAALVQLVKMGEEDQLYEVLLRLEEGALFSVAAEAVEQLARLSGRPPRLSGGT